MEIRAAQIEEVDALAQLWYDGWQDAHAAIVPAELKAARTLDRFRERLLAALGDVRVCSDASDASDAPAAGFHWLKDDELYQLYVGAQARGKGAARALMADAETLLAARGVRTAWLSCAIGNHRAARFYEKSGWTRVGNMVDELQLPSGPFELETWRFEKSLVPADGKPSHDERDPSPRSD
jgi:GNAT superfamily N-acetyltransferase